MVVKPVKPWKVLIVDDMEEGREFLIDLLDHMGIESVPAVNGKEAMMLLEKDDYDLIISDILMPVMDGFQLSRRVKGHPRLNKIPLMFFSGTYVDEADEALAQKVGAECLVRKPVQMDDLLQIIKGLLHPDREYDPPVQDASAADEKEVLNLYSERLINQLEKKMIELENEVRERRLKEAQLKISRQRLRDLSGHLQEAREQERTSLSREIHDELGQALTALKMDTAFLSGTIQDEKSVIRIDSMLGVITNTLAFVRELTTALRPGMLDDLGLTAAIQWQVGEFQKRSGIRCVLTCEDEEMDLHPDVSTAVFRILQETLTNILRHSKASNVSIDLRKQDGILTMEVKDNGVGIRKEDQSRKNSFGIMGMKERSLALGGTIEITGEEGHGTLTVLTVPGKERLLENEDPHN